MSPRVCRSSLILDSATGDGRAPVAADAGSESRSDRLPGK